MYPVSQKRKKEINNTSISKSEKCSPAIHAQLQHIRCPPFTLLQSAEGFKEESQWVCQQVSSKNQKLQLSLRLVSQGTGTQWKTVSCPHTHPWPPPSLDNVRSQFWPFLYVTDIHWQCQQCRCQWLVCLCVCVCVCSCGCSRSALLSVLLFVCLLPHTCKILVTGQLKIEKDIQRSTWVTQFRWACFWMVLLPPFVMAFLPIMPATMTDKQLMADRSQSAEK